MKTAVVFTAIPALLVALALPARADQSKEPAPGGPSAVVYDAGSAFDFLATMAGEWERASGGHDHGGKSKLTTFKVTAAGSSVLETIFPGESSEMLTVYHRDGDDLLLTHYCALHNAPVMKFQKSDKPGEIKFVFVGGTNFGPQRRHARSRRHAASEGRQHGGNNLHHLLRRQGGAALEGNHETQAGQVSPAAGVDAPSKRPLISRREMSAMAHEWANWSGSVTCRPRQLLSPASEDEVVSRDCALARRSTAQESCV